MVSWRFSLFCTISALAALLSSCSDDSKNPFADYPDLGEGPLPFEGGPVKFTEVDPINISYKDHEGDDAGWVELYNSSDSTINLSGMH